MEKFHETIDMAKVYKTRNGYPVRLLADNLRGQYPVAGVIHLDELDLVETWTAKGDVISPSQINLHDLIEAKPQSWPRHSPAPWSIEEHGDGFALYSGRTKGLHGLSLVNLKEPDWNWERNKPLIEAAPLLLKALEDIIDMARPDCPKAFQRVQEARAIIAQAKGAEPENKEKTHD